MKNGTKNVPFSWHIVANRVSKLSSNPNGGGSDFASLRFPEALKVISLEETDSRVLTIKEDSKHIKTSLPENPNNTQKPSLNQNK